jgi:predicted metallopeptidase
MLVFAEDSHSPPVKHAWAIPYIRKCFISLTPVRDRLVISADTFQDTVSESFKRLSWESRWSQLKHSLLVSLACHAKPVSGPCESLTIHL